MANKPFFKGLAVKLIFLRDSKKVELKTKTIDITKNVTESHDGVNGELRDRNQVTCNYFEIQIEAFLEDLREVDVLLADQQQLDTRTQPVEKGFSLVIQPNDGSTWAAEAINPVIGGWNLNVPGRSENVMLKVPLFADDVVGLPVV